MIESAVGAARLIAGRYELEARIGKGGIGEVWRARHLALNSYVAIKFLQGASAQNESTRRRFTAEAQITAQLKSQHAVQVFDFGVTDEGHPYLVMELLEGETLGRRLEREGRIGILDTARILGQSARALHRAHQLGIVHRDFKPDNIVVGVDDEGRDYVKVVDFGLAKLVGDLEPPSQAPPTNLAEVSAGMFTKTGAMLGTPNYMAPEQVRSAGNVDLRADIWAFGVVAFECLTGCIPFTGETLAELFEKIETGKHPDADKLEPSVPAAFHEWFDTACAPDPTKRFPDANTAWKKLLVALDCGKVDINPSMALGRTVSTNSDNQVIVRSEANVADGNAVTLDAPARKGGVEPRQRRPNVGTASGTLPTEAVPVPVASDPQALSHSIAEEERTRPRARDPQLDAAAPARRAGGARTRALLVALPLIALASVVAWRVSSAPAPVTPRIETSPAASHATQPAPGGESAPPPVEPDRVPATSAPETVVPVVPVPRASASSGRPAASHARVGAATVPPATTKPPSIAPPAAPAPTTPAPTSTATAADPGSYR